MRGAPRSTFSGPLVTDGIAAGYDHIAGAIGGVIAAAAGAYSAMSPRPSTWASPSPEDAGRIDRLEIAAHAADLIRRGGPGARSGFHDEMSGPGKSWTLEDAGTMGR